jgi:hypothetical protein
MLSSSWEFERHIGMLSSSLLLWALLKRRHAIILWLDWKSTVKTAGYARPLTWQASRPLTRQTHSDSITVWQTRHNAIIILWVRHATIVLSAWQNLVSSTDTSACYHHLVSLTCASTSCDFDKCDRHISSRHIDMLSSWCHHRLRSTIYHHAIIILWFRQTQRNATMMHHHLLIRVSELLGHVDMPSSSFEFDSHVASKIARVHNHLLNKESWACVSTHIWAMQIRRIENDLKEMYQPSPTLSTHVCSIR